MTVKKKAFWKVKILPKIMDHFYFLLFFNEDEMLNDIFIQLLSETTVNQERTL